jgi:hypothetical protein
VQLHLLADLNPKLTEIPKLMYVRLKYNGLKNLFALLLLFVVIAVLSTSDRTSIYFFYNSLRLFTNVST